MIFTFFSNTSPYLFLKIVKLLIAVQSDMQVLKIKMTTSIKLIKKVKNCNTETLSTIKRTSYKYTVHIVIPYNIINAYTE